MKLEVGMYVRTDNGIIGKIYEQIGDMFTYKDSNRNYITYDLSHNEILKASHSIIDLIEAGDIITFKNSNDVYKVSSIPNDMIDGFYLEYDLNYPETEDIYVDKEEMENALKSIVTKEQFENMSYKVVEE